jgi:hypothetical protein
VISREGLLVDSVGTREVDVNKSLELLLACFVLRSQQVSVSPNSHPLKLDGARAAIRSMPDQIGCHTGFILGFAHAAQYTGASAMKRWARRHLCHANRGTEAIDSSGSVATIASPRLEALGTLDNLSYRFYLASLSIKSLNQFADKMSKAEGLIAEITCILNSLPEEAHQSLRQEPPPSASKLKHRLAAIVRI